MMKLKRILFSLGVLLILSVTLLPVNASALEPKPAADPYTLIAEVNALRTSNGLAPYAVNATLMSIAQAHSDYQASTGIVTHYGADGSRPYQRALAAGYPVGGTLSAGGFFSENIQAGMNLSPAGAVQAWQGDAPHLNTMLSPHLTEAGAGVTNVNGYIYYTLDASTPSNSSNTPNTPDPNATPNDGGALPTLDYIMPVIISTPNEKGEVIHETQVGQSLWGIADIYGTTVQEIRKLNNMSVDEAIFPGELLLIRTVPTEIPSTPTLVVESVSTVIQPDATEPSLPTSVSPSSIPEKTPTEIPSQKVEMDGGLRTVILIIFVALLMAGVVTWLSGRE